MDPHQEGAKEAVQFNPPKQLEFDAAEIERLWRVIDWEEALGFA